MFFFLHVSNDFFSTFSALILKFLKSWVNELVLVLVYVPITKKNYLLFKLFPHQIGPNWSNQQGENTVPSLENVQTKGKKDP